jgi:hypothetical protein
MRHGTRAQADFVLQRRGLSLAAVEDRHRVVRDAVARVAGAIPLEWRRASVDRRDLDRFLFEPEDIIVAVGQDGLVANVAKYAGDQVVIGVNPGIYDGILVTHRAEAAGALLAAAAAGEGVIEARTLVEATTPDGQRLRALNEIFLGHKSHQSAKYTLAFDGRSERHSSSGMLVGTGTGATGWSLSIARQRNVEVPAPKPCERSLRFFVREAWPSRATGASLTEGVIPDGAALEFTSEMNVGGVAFGDGIEDDHLELMWGQKVTVRAAAQALRLFRG